MVRTFSGSFCFFFSFRDSPFFFNLSTILIYLNDIVISSVSKFLTGRHNRQNVVKRIRAAELSVEAEFPTFRIQENEGYVEGFFQLSGDFSKTDFIKEVGPCCPLADCVCRNFSNFCLLGQSVINGLLLRFHNDGIGRGCSVYHVHRTFSQGNGYFLIVGIGFDIEFCTQYFHVDFFLH